MKPTQEQVIAWAREAGGYPAAPESKGSLLYMSQPSLERLATLAYEAGRKDENEACAEACERLAEHDVPGGILGRSLRCAAAIRARREQ